MNLAGDYEVLYNILKVLLKLDPGCADTKDSDISADIVVNVDYGTEDRTVGCLFPGRLRTWEVLLTASRLSRFLSFRRQRGAG